MPTNRRGLFKTGLGLGGGALGAWLGSKVPKSTPSTVPLPTVGAPPTPVEMGGVPLPRPVADFVTSRYTNYPYLAASFAYFDTMPRTLASVNYRAYAAPLIAKEATPDEDEYGDDEQDQDGWWGNGPEDNEDT